MQLYKMNPNTSRQPLIHALHYCTHVSTIWSLPGVGMPADGVCSEWRLLGVDSGLLDTSVAVEAGEQLRRGRLGVFDLPNGGGDEIVRWTVLGVLDFTETEEGRREGRERGKRGGNGGDSNNFVTCNWTYMYLYTLIHVHVFTCKYWGMHDECTGIS